MDTTGRVMSGKTICPGCGAALPPNAAPGLCPRCVLKDALDLGREEMSPTAPAAGARVGRRFGDYELLDLIGRGGMGVVYKAHQFSLNQDVALKMVLDGRQSSTRAIRRFQLEAEVSARLRHSNIVRIYHTGEEDGDVFFTMELIHGESLSRRLARGEFHLLPADATKTALHGMQTRIARLMATTARAVHYAHEQGVLHRDIKPGNIILDAEGEPHLTDFGLAKLADTATKFSESGSIAGTPAYMSPEQARGERLTTAADTYSVGVILYELLTGRTPFSAATPVETLRQITDSEPPNPAQITNGQVDTDLATICMKCLEKNPAARYATARDLADDLERWLRNEPIRARRVGTVVRLQRWVRRNPVGASLIAVLVLGVVTTTLLSFRLRVARQEAERGEKIAQRRADAILDGIVASIEQLWGNTNQQFHLIPSEELSAFLDSPRPAVDYFAPHTRLTIGLSVTESPVGQAGRFAKPFAQMEDRMTELLGQRVLLDLKLFKFNNAKVAEVISGQVHIAALGAYAYVRAKAQEPRITLIARQSEPKDAAIFTRKGAGITNFSQFAGKRLALGDPGATISLWAKVHCARAGILGSNLVWHHFNSKPAFLEKLQREGLRKLTNERSHSHAAAIDAVLANEADLGVARRDYVQDLTKRQLDIIFEFNSTPQLWVATRKADVNVAAAFRQAFIESRTIELVDRTTRRQIVRLVPVEDSYFDDLRAALTNEVARFEGDHPIQSRLDGFIGGDDE